MNEHRKNPFRRPPTSGERRPGLRQLPKDFDDLATGKTERLRRPRKAPGPLHDEREGAVIAGVRNTEARAVYDARVRALRQHLADGRHAELQAGLEAARQMRLWRARNVTDFRAFVESVVGLSPEQAAALSASDEPDAARFPDHVVALAVRLEAALLAHAKSATVALRVDDAGELKLSLELPAGDVHRAVDAVEDAGRAVSGLRYFLRDDERPRGYSDRDGAAGSGERRPPRERRDDYRSDRREGDAGERRLSQREDARARDSADAQSERELDASAVIESAVAAAGGETADAREFGDDQPVRTRSRYDDSQGANESDDDSASVNGSVGDRDDDDIREGRADFDEQEFAVSGRAARVDVADDDFGDDASDEDASDDRESEDDESASDRSADEGADDEESDVGEADGGASDDDEAAVDRSVDADADDDESDDDESDDDESDEGASDDDESDSGAGEQEDVAAAGVDAGSRPLTRGRAGDASAGERDAGSRPFGRRREGGAFSRDGGDDRGASRGPEPDRSFGNREGGDAGSQGFAGSRERRDFGNRGGGDDRGFGRDRERGSFGNRGGDDRSAGPRGFGRGRDQGGDQRGFGRGRDQGGDQRGGGPRDFGRGRDQGGDQRGGARGREQGTFDRRGPADQSAGGRGFGSGRFDKRGPDDRNAPRFGGQGERRDSGPGRFGRDREQGGFDKRDGGPRRFGAGREQAGFNDRDAGASRERGRFNDRGRDDRDAGPRFGRGGDDRNAGARFARGPQQGFDKRGPDDRGPKGNRFDKPKGGPKKDPK